MQADYEVTVRTVLVARSAVLTTLGAFGRLLQMFDTERIEMALEHILAIKDLTFKIEPYFDNLKFYFK